MSLVQTTGWLEERHRACLKAQAGEPAGPCRIDDVSHQGRSNSLSADLFRYAHGFNFAMRLIQLLECATSDEQTFAPGSPKSDLRFSQTVEIQGVFAFRWRHRAHIAEMFFKKSGNFRTVQIVDAYDHGRDEKRISCRLARAT